MNLKNVLDLIFHKNQESLSIICLLPSMVGQIIFFKQQIILKVRFSCAVSSFSNCSMCFKSNLTSEMYVQHNAHTAYLGSLVHIGCSLTCWIFYNLDERHFSSPQKSIHYIDSTSNFTHTIFYIVICYSLTVPRTLLSPKGKLPARNFQRI